MTPGFQAVIFGLLFGLTPSLMQAVDEDELQKEQVSQREDIKQLQEKMGQTQSDVQAFRIENETLKAEVTRLKVQFSSVQKEVAALEALIKKVDQVREQDRKTIVEEVSKEIAKLVKKTSGGNGGKAPPTTKPPPVKTVEGLEHTVAKGESLAAIADAYGVSKKSIVEANKLTKSELKTGQKLFIPKKER